MLFSYLFTTSSPIPLLFLHLNSVVSHSLLIVPVVGGECFSHSCNSCRLSCVEVTRGLVENGRNFWCNIGATQPIGIFLPPPTCISTQLCALDILPPSRNSSQLCGFAIFNSFHHSPCNGFLPSFVPPPPHHSHHCLDGWSASTGCARFHLSTTSLNPFIISARTPDHFSQSFHLIKYIQLPSIYFWPATVATSNSSKYSNYFSAVVFCIPVSHVTCTPLLRVKIFFSRLRSIQPASSAPSNSFSQ